MNPSTRDRARGFTLVELMMVIAIVAILAAISMAALAGAAEEGKRQRVRTQIYKIDQLINDKWNSYRFRQLPIRMPVGVNANLAAQVRLNAMRELQRMEMPDRLNDILDGPTPAIPTNPVAITRPALSNAYARRVTPAAASTLSYDSAEMLYLIIAEMRDGERSALDFFLTSEIGDVDQDGMYEILDPWGTPIMWLRWAPGYSRYDANDPMLAGKIAAPAPLPSIVVDTIQYPDGSTRPDPFDPLKADPRFNNGMANGFLPFKLSPLIFSAGPDRVYDIYTDDQVPFHYNPMARTPADPADRPSDPYHVMVMNGANTWIGTPVDYDGDGLQHGDNISNHGLAVETGTNE
jgi:prepilin-type N-terminal cleavage/methylation domain-containing protein